MNNKYRYFDNSIITFYFIFVFILLLFIVLFIILSYNIKFTLFENLFSEQIINPESKIIFMQGNDIFYSIKNKKLDLIKFNTKITGEMTIETGENSILVFYINNHGIYYLFPNTILYITHIDKFISENLTKETKFIIEKGSIYFNLNLLSNNNNLIVNTTTAYIIANKSEFIVDKENDFNTKIFCLNGILYYRPYSSKFEFYKQKRIYDITSSIQRIIDKSNFLMKNEKTYLDNNKIKRLDNILIKIYDSKTIKYFDKKYIENNLIFRKFNLYNENMIENIKYYNFINNIMFQENCFLELYIPKTKSNFLFLNEALYPDQYYFFNLYNGVAQLIEQIDNIKIYHNIHLSDNEIKKIKISNLSFINQLFINGIQINFNTIKLNNTNINEINNNYYLLEMKITKVNIKEIFIKSNYKVKNLYLINKNNNSNFFIRYNKETLYFNKIKIKNQNNIKINNTNGIDILENFDFNNKLFILIELYDIYNINY